MDVNTVKDGLGKEIDEKIKPLVQSLWDLGIETTQSCEGHYDWGHPHPWVEVHDQQDLSKLQKYTGEWNDSSDVKWQLGKHSCISPDPLVMAYRLKPDEKSGYDLKVLQENSKKFAGYLSNKN